jgi:hypothetical protein
MLGGSNPLPSAVYYDDLSKAIGPDCYPVLVDKIRHWTRLFGQAGITNNTGTYIIVFDWAVRTDVMHEIGHVIMNAGIPPGRQRF